MKNLTILLTQWKTLLIFLITLEAYLLPAQNFAWVHQIGGTLEQRSNAVTTDSDGNVYATGYFEGTVDFDPGPATYNLTSAGGYDIFITKVSAAGSLIWVKQIGGSNSTASDEGKSIAVGPAGDIYVTGTFRDAVDFDPGVGEYFMVPLPPYYETCTSGTDVFILKLNANGDFIWAKQIGGNGFDKVSSITLSSGENVYVAGQYVSEQNVPVDFDPNAGTFYLTPLAGAAGFLLKLDMDGAFLWAKQWYSSGISAGPCGSRDALVHLISLSIDGDANILCTGDFGSTVDFDPDQGVYSIGTLSNAAFVMKLNSNGGFQWARALNNAGNHAYGKDVVAGANGNVYSVGAFDGTIDFDPGAAIKNLKAPGGSGPSGIGPSEAYVWVLNSLGNYVWAGQLGGSTDDGANSVDLDGTGNMYITGTFTGTADFNPGSAKNTLKSAGGPDVFVSKLTVSGAYIWAVRMGGTSADYSFALDVDASGAILTTGTFQGTADFDPNSGTYNLTSSGGNDAFVHKMAQSQGANLAGPWTDEVQVVEAHVFPNPSTELLNVDFACHIEDARIQIYDLKGQLMMEQKHVTGKSISIDISRMPGGLYLVNIQDDVKSACLPFVKTE